MAATKVERRVYSASPVQLFGICLAVLGQQRARIEQHDVERGTITAVFGDRSLGPASQLALALRPLGEARTELVATWQAHRRGGDRRLLRVFLEAVGGMLESA
jgi:hypothetical protein